MNGMQYTRSHMLVAIGPFRGTEMKSEHHESMKHFKAEYVSFLRGFFSFFPSRKCYARIMPGSSIKSNDSRGPSLLRSAAVPAASFLISAIFFFLELFHGY